LFICEDFHDQQKMLSVTELNFAIIQSNALYGSSSKRQFQCKLVTGL